MNYTDVRNQINDEGMPSGPTGIISGIRDEATPGKQTVGTASTSGMNISPGLADMLGMAVTQLSKSPEAGRAVSGLSKGKAPESVAIDTAISGAKRAGLTAAAKQGLNMNVVAPAVGYAVSTAKNVIDEMSLENPNMSRAAMKAAPSSFGAMLGGLAFGPIGMMVGSMVGGYFGAQSMADGILGDIADMRSYETMRDTLEEDGLSRGDTATMAGERAGMQMEPGGVLSPSAGIDPTVSPSMKDIAMSGYYDTLDMGGVSGHSGDPDGAEGDMDDGGSSNDNDSMGGYGGASDEEGDGEN